MFIITTQFNSICCNFFPFFVCIFSHWKWILLSSLRMEKHFIINDNKNSIKSLLVNVWIHFMAYSLMEFLPGVSGKKKKFSPSTSSSFILNKDSECLEIFYKQNFSIFVFCVVHFIHQWHVLVRKLYFFKI